MNMPQSMEQGGRNLHSIKKTFESLRERQKQSLPDHRREKRNHRMDPAKGRRTGGGKTGI